MEKGKNIANTSSPTYSGNWWRGSSVKVGGIEELCSLHAGVRVPGEVELPVAGLLDPEKLSTRRVPIHGRYLPSPSSKRLQDSRGLGPRGWFWSRKYFSGAGRKGGGDKAVPESTVEEGDLNSHPPSDELFNPVHQR